MSPEAERTHVDEWEHVVHFYDAESVVIHAASTYFIESLRNDATVVVVATPSHRAAFTKAITAAGIDVEEARIAGRIVDCDAQETLSTFFANGSIDAELFDINIGEVIRLATKAGRPVHAFGEMVSLLWDDGHIQAAVELEELWNDLGKQEAFSLFCAYPSASMAGLHRAEAVDTIRTLHTGEVTMPVGPQIDIRHFEFDAMSVAAARHFVVELLQQWRLEHLIDRSAIVITELAANAVVHAKSAFDVEIGADHGDVRLVVSDGSVDQPKPRQAEADAASGRGLAMVEVLCDAWGYEPNGTGKSVWATLSPEVSN